METLSDILWRKPLVSDGFPEEEPEMLKFDIFFVVCLNNKQPVICNAMTFMWREIIVMCEMSWYDISCYKEI